MSSDINIQLGIDDSKVSIVRGPASCRDFALKHLQEKAKVCLNTESIEELEAAIKWLQSLQV